MHSLKFYVVIISIVVVLAAEKDKEKSQDILRSGSSYATVQSSTSGLSNCDVVAKFLAAYANNIKANSDNYSATAPNYASQIAALYGVLNAAQNHAGHSTYSAPAHASSGYASSSSSAVKPISGYTAPTAASGYSSGASGYSSAAKPAPSGYSAVKPATSYSTPAAASGYSSSSYGYSTPAPTSAYSAGVSGYSSSSLVVKPASGYSAPAPTSGYSSGGSGYSSSSSSAVKPASGYTGYAAPSFYERLSNIATYNAGIDGPPPATMDLINARNYYATQPQQAYGMMSALYSPASFNLENERSASSAGYISSKTDGAIKSVKIAEYAPQPASAAYYAGKVTSDSVPQSYSRFANDPATNYRSHHYGGSSSDYGSADNLVPVPVCPQNYLLSCESSVQSVPCVQQQQGHSAKY